MNRKIKAVAIDLDGTWLDGQSRISQRTLQTVQKVVDNGYCVIPTTGRSYRNTAKVLEAYQGLAYFVNANGTTVTDARAGRLLFSHPMPRQIARRVYELAGEYTCFVELYIGMDAYVDRARMHYLYESGVPASYCDQLLCTNQVVEDLDVLLDEEICKFHIMCRTLEEKERLMHQLGQISDISVAASFPKNIEVVYQDWSKAKGLQKAAEALGFSREELLAVGDSDNDYEMLSWAGVSVAMGNAGDRVKAAADYVSTSNDEDGLAKALEECLGL